jgi:membrane associated rhomboid family serine protease
MVEIASGDRCPSCGATALDPLAATNREAVEMIVAMRHQRRAKEWIIAPLALLVGVAPFVALAFAEHGDVLAVVPYVGLLAILLIVGISAIRHKEWRVPTEDPHPVRTALTSASMVALVVCLVFVVVKEQVGVEALWMGRELPWWRVALGTFTHAGAAHLALMLFGPAIDRRVGPVRTAIALAAAAVGAAAAHMLTTATPGVGFSGAIYGLFGATLVLMPGRPQVLSLPYVVIPMPTWAWMLVIVPVYTLVAALDATSSVAWVAHLGGFVAGALVAVPMRRVAKSAAFLGAEERRRSHLAGLARLGLAEDLGSSFDGPRGAPSPDMTVATDPEVAAFHRAARRRRRAAMAIGGSVLVVSGLGFFALATLMDAPAFAAGRRVHAMIASLVVALAGVVMVVGAFRTR